MNTSPIAIDLIEAIENYIAESSKVGYRFEIEEELKIRREIAILENQLKILSDYEMKKRGK